MTSIQRFEDLICWQKARELARQVYQSFRDCKDYGFRDQIQRAAVSVVSNIAEGFERGTKSEFVNYLYIAKGSAAEVRAQLYVALDIRYINIETFKHVNMLAQECSRLIQSFANKVKGGSQQGLQFKRVLRPDPMKEVLKEHAPDVYERFYGNKK